MRMSELLNEVRRFELDEGFSPREIKMAIGIASDPRYAKGNMTGAVNAIEKMKKGLSKHPQVMAVLKRQNEDVDIDEALSEDSMNVELDNDKLLMRNIEKMGVKIKILNRFGKNPDVQLIGKKDKINKVVDKYQTSMRTDNNFAFNETNKNDKSDDGEGMDAVQPKAVKKKFDDRKDKDIDNDGDTDSTDKYLHKRRKAISKAINSGDDFKPHMMYDPKTGKGYEAKTMEDHLRMKKMGYDHEKPKMENFIGTPENTKAKLDATPGQSSDDWNQQVEVMHKKQASMREALAKVWGMEEGKNPFEKKEEKKSSKKEDKTMTGKPATKVTIDPDMKEKKN